jgi:cysteinyl-tRNA synthetase
VRRYLVYRGYDVTYVMNYTDVDDKIITRARAERIPPEGVTSKYTKAFEEDMAALGMRPADIIVKATEHIEDMIKAVEELIEKGAAYEVDGNVWFSVAAFHDYGKLSGRSVEELRAGERVEPHADKHHPLDFALWKTAKEDEPAWPSPWGPGRPGWHIECSVMSTKYLGMGFDLHGGGSDLVFPHHENEIAQAEAATGGEFVRHWMHAGMVQMGSEKMSKSLGNVVPARDAITAVGGEPLRYWSLSASYRSQSAFTDDAVADSRAALDRWRTFVQAANHALGDAMPEAPAPRRRTGDDAFEGETGSYIRRFVEAMDDDFNSAGAFAVIHELVRDANKEMEEVQRGAAPDHLAAFVDAFLELTSLLGFSFENGREASGELTAGLVELLLELREQARADKAFERADAIRTRLAGLGVVIEDTPAGPRWRTGA